MGIITYLSSTSYLLLVLEDVFHMVDCCRGFTRKILQSEWPLDLSGQRCARMILCHMVDCCRAFIRVLLQSEWPTIVTSCLANIKRLAI